MQASRWQFKKVWWQKSRLTLTICSVTHVTEREPYFDESQIIGNREVQKKPLRLREFQST